uniref:Ig-like domain-containing protein n=1 Tax=Pelusios castaneus TaxID=367368 RepID=A0A8C8SQ99_9SAUR
RLTQDNWEQRTCRFVSPPLNAGLFVNPGGPYPKPSISVSPAGVIPVGGNVTIRCRQHHYPGLRIQLYRDGIWNYLNYTDPAGSEAEFPIPSVSREHGDRYRCRYHIGSGYSEPSDPVEIIVAGEPDPRGSPPAPTSQWDVQPVSVGEGHLCLVPWTPGRPCPVSAPPRWAGRGGCPRVCLRPVSAPGSAPPILDPPGLGLKPDSGFFLHKAGDLNPQEHVDPAGNWTEFRIPDVGRQHGGRYSCSYRLRSQPFVSSEPSDPVELLVAGEGPTISLRPSSVPAPGANVTIRCEGPGRDVRFFLHKAGDLNPQEHVDPAGDWAEFRIPDVGPQHGGRYSCSYRPRSQPFVSSEPSDPVELLVAGERPNAVAPFLAPQPVGPFGGVFSAPLGSALQGSPYFIIRLGLGATVLLILVLILAEACYSWQWGAS